MGSLRILGAKSDCLHPRRSSRQCPVPRCGIETVRGLEQHRESRTPLTLLARRIKPWLCVCSNGMQSCHARGRRQGRHSLRGSRQGRHSRRHNRNFRHWSCHCFLGSRSQLLHLALIKHVFQLFVSVGWGHLLGLHSRLCRCGAMVKPIQIRVVII